MFANNLKGEQGGETLGDGDSLSGSGPFVGALVLTETVINEITRPDFSGESLNGVTLAAGTFIGGRITAFSITTGLVDVYLSHTQSVQ